MSGRSRMLPMDEAIFRRRLRLDNRVGESALAVMLMIRSVQIDRRDYRSMLLLTRCRATLTRVRFAHAL